MHEKFLKKQTHASENLYKCYKNLCEKVKNISGIFRQSNNHYLQYMHAALSLLQIITIHEK